MIKIKAMRILKTYLMAVSAIVLCCATSCEKDKYPELGEGLFAEFVTNKGTIVVKLTHELTPVTVANFVALAEGKHPMVAAKYGGKPYYNGLIFHRVMDNFMIQGGCPEGTGRGTPGYRFGDEFDDSLRHDKPGILSMANSGPGSNGSQFFITERPTPHLDEKHSVFGEVVMGLEIQDSISNVKTGERDKPVEDVVLEQVNIVRQGFDARKFDAVKTWEIELPLLAERNQKRQEELAKRAEEERKAAQEKAEKAAAEVLVLLDDYKSKATAAKSGLMSYQIEQGEGPSPKQGDQVKVHYDGYFTDGKLFGSSDKELEKVFGIYSMNKEQRGFYGELTMTISPEARLIAGFKEAVAQMRVGDKYYFYMPSHLAWGEQGSPPTIPPNADVIYIIKMLSLVE